jgi:rare lipoprotein A
VIRLAVSILALALLAGCAGQRPQPSRGSSGPDSAGQGAAPPGAGGYYKDDGPSADTPENLAAIPDPVPRWEPLHKGAARPYVVFGRAYTPNTTVKPFRQRGIASWYGKKFHGQLTSTGERYDMFSLSAAHPTLALPSYLRVTNPANGKQVVVRVNDRGPFHASRIIDLSYTAAFKLGLIGKGSGEVEIEAIVPGEPSGYVQANAAKPVLQNSPAPAADDIGDLMRDLDRADALNTGGERGVFVQLAAFGSPENAENLRVHLSRELEWLEQPLRIYTAGNVHRVQAGPFASRADADRVAERIRSETGNKPSVVSH